MTNITVAVFIAVATNWSGLVFNATNEVGFVVTNHVARIEYAGKTNEFVLLSEPSNIYTLRPWIGVENRSIVFGSDTLWVTNALQKAYTELILGATNWGAPLTSDWTNWSKAP